MQRLRLARGCTGRTDFFNGERRDCIARDLAATQLAYATVDCAPDPHREHLLDDGVRHVLEGATGNLVAQVVHRLDKVP